MAQPTPTLFLGPVTINGSDFNFNDGVVTAPTPSSDTDVVNKLYVDQLVQSQADRINGDAELLKKIDMLFLYFFRNTSKSAFIDEEFQIQFKDKFDPKAEANNNNNN